MGMIVFYKFLCDFCDVKYLYSFEGKPAAEPVLPVGWSSAWGWDGNTYGRIACPAHSVRVVNKNHLCAGETAEQEDHHLPAEVP